MKRVRMLRWLIELAELIWYKKKQRFIFKRPDSDSLGEGCPVFYLEVTGSAALIRKAGVGTPHFKAQSYVRCLRPGRPLLQPNSSLNTAPAEAQFLAWARRTLRPIAQMLKSQLQAWISHLSAFISSRIEFFSRCYPCFASPKLVRKQKKNSWKSPEIRNKFNLSGQKKVVGVLGWNGTISLDDERQQIGRPRITGLHSIISASFRFTRQNSHCIGQAGLRVGRFARLASKPVRT